MERLSELLPGAVSEFVGCSLEMQRANVRTDDIYDHIKQRLVICDKILDRAYNSAYVQHFYTPKQIDEFRERWTTDT